LTFAPDLAVPTRIALIEAAAEIWSGTGIAIDWQPGGGPCEPPRCIRALVLRRPVALHTTSDVARQVGELLRLETGGAVVIVSVNEAERIVREAPSQRPRLGLLEGDRVGTVLGRAMAHELGHYLLGTATHASRGLMRARFEPREFADLRSEAFRLDTDALSWLRTQAEARRFRTPTEAGPKTGGDAVAARRTCFTARLPGRHTASIRSLSHLSEAINVAISSARFVPLPDYRAAGVRTIRERRRRRHRPRHHGRRGRRRHHHVVEPRDGRRGEAPERR
jgi:hypothetical protein